MSLLSSLQSKKREEEEDMMYDDHIIKHLINTLVYIKGVIKYSEIINDPVYLSYELAIQKAQLIL